MWYYEKKLQYPVKVSRCNPMLAKYLIEQYGGADGELSAALRYLNQRYTIPDKVVGLLNDIGTEEFAHLEMIATMIYKLTKDATPEQLVAAGLGEHFVNHDHALYYQNAAGSPWTATYIQAKGDPIVFEDIKAPTYSVGASSFNFTCTSLFSSYSCTSITVALIVGIPVFSSLPVNVP